MKKQLKIKLMSDLCAGSGKNYAAVIDLDTAVDEYGIPYIPSRRLKGCMREVAEMLEIKNESIDKIFGVSASSDSGALSISDARISDYADAVNAVAANGITPEAVTELFCSVRAETALKNDTAKEHSLRFIRVVNRISSINWEPMEFFADIELSDDKEYDELEKIVKGLRNIGYHRNRGLGAVKCTLEENAHSFSLKEYDFSDDTEYELCYTVRVHGDLMLPSSDTNRSQDYISGTCVLGAIASKYKADNFNEIFLSGNVKFGNLYISEFSQDGTELFIPAPRFLAEIKTQASKEIHNTIGKDKTAEQYKPLKKGYVNTKLGHRQPKTKIAYHNAVTDKDGGLYTQQCVCSGQLFSGSITAKGMFMKEIYPLFADGVISFGRSKTAQYARCEIADPTIAPVQIETVQLKKGQVAAWLCESDVILTDKNGLFTVDFDAFANSLTSAADTICEESELGTKIISGFNSKWNMKKPQFPAVCAGSVLVFIPSQDITLPEIKYVGEKQNEGFGKLRLISDAAAFRVNVTDDSYEPYSNETAHGIVNAIEESILDKHIVKSAIDVADKISLNSSQIGRIMLMCKESENIYDFAKRTHSIKTDSVRREAEKHFSESCLKQVLSALFVAKAPKDSEYLWSKYRKYIITALTVKKYRLRSGK